MSTSPKAFPFLSPAEQPDEIGRLGTYRVLELIGEGGMGKVFLAEDQRLRRKVALKVMSQKIASSKNARQRFIREARAQAAVHHDNVATIFEVDEQNNTPFLAMELLQGQSLEEILRKGYKFNAKQIIALGRQIARGLTAAHKEGIIHRDIKPANIWIETDKGRPKILDFGLAAMSGPVDTLSRRGAVVGTPGYLSPEQACDEAVDDRSDIYSLGIVLYEMCCGMLPFRYSSVAMMLIAITAHAPRSLKEFTDDVPESLSDLIDRLLSKEPKDRPASAAALIDELKAIADEPSSSSKSASPNHSDGLPFRIDIQDEAPIRSTPAVKKQQTKTATIAAIATGALIAIIAAIALWPRSNDPQTTRVNLPSTVDSKPKLRSKPVTAAMLKPLQIEAVTPEAERIVAGQPALIRFRVVNVASSSESDPALAAAGASIAAKIHVFLKPDANAPERPAPMFPLRIAGSRIPKPGKSLDLLVRFETADISPGSYDASLRLTTSDDKPVSQAETRIWIAADYSSGSLSGFQAIPTRTGTGADTTVARGDDKPRGEGDVLSVHHAEQDKEPLEYVYLRFDLSGWNHPLSKLQDAVVTLSLKGGVQERQELRLYGIESHHLPAWIEKGDGALVWGASPTATNLGKARFLTATTIDNSQNQMASKEADNVRFFGEELDAFLKSSKDKQVNFVVVRHSKHNQPTIFFSKESDRIDNVPSLHLKAE